MSSFFKKKCSCSGQEQGTFKFTGRVTFKFTPWQVTSGGQLQYYFQMKCTAQVYPKFSEEVFMQ